MTGIRVFLAVNLSIDVLRRVSEAQRELRSKCVEAGWEITWVAPTHLHLSLRFLGEIGSVLVPPMQDALKPVVEPGPPIPLGVTGFRLVEHESKEREIVLDVWDSVGALAALRKTLAAPLEELGFKPEGEGPGSPVPLVVARIGSPDGDVPLAELLESARNIDFGICEAKNLVLYSAESVRAGQEYPRQWRIQFSGDAEPLEQIHRAELAALAEESSTDVATSDESPAEEGSEEAEQEAPPKEGADAEADDSPESEPPASEPEEPKKETSSTPADEGSEDAE